jgi:hypothetical protein
MSTTQCDGVLSLSADEYIDKRLLNCVGTVLLTWRKVVKEADIDCFHETLRTTLELCFLLLDCALLHGCARGQIGADVHCYLLLLQDYMPAKFKRANT